MKIERGHGDHWDIFDVTDGNFLNLIPEVIENGKPAGEGCLSVSINGMPKKKWDVYAKRFDNNDLSIVVILANCKDLTNNIVVSHYPCSYNGMTYEMTVEKVHKWSSGAEATVEATLESGETLSFFAIDYYTNSQLYKKGNKIRVCLSAFAYNAEVPLEEEDDDSPFYSDEVKAFFSDLIKKAEQAEDGKVIPLWDNTKDVVSYMPDEDEYMDEAEFQSPIQSVEETSFLEIPLYKIGILINQDPDVEVPLYAPQGCFEQQPAEGDSLSGDLWLHGYIEKEGENLRPVGGASLSKIPYKYTKFYVTGIEGIDLEKFWETSFSYCEVDEPSGKIVKKTNETDGDSQHYFLYKEGASTQGVAIIFYPGKKPFMRIELPWLACVGDVQLASTFLMVLQKMYPKCEIVYDDGKERNAFEANEETYSKLIHTRLENMEYLVSSPIGEEHYNTTGLFRNFVIPSKQDFPDMDTAELAMKAMSVFMDLQWKYNDYEYAPLRDSIKEGEEGKYKVSLLFNNRDVMVGISPRLILYGNNRTYKDVSAPQFIEKVAKTPYLKMVDPMQFTLKRMPDDEWNKLYKSFEAEETPIEDGFYKNYLLRWNPKISSFTLKNYDDITSKYPDGFGLNWSVYEWEHAEQDDYFYMLRTGDDKAGIVFRGFFTSDPFEADDWAGKGKKRHYMDLFCDEFSQPDEPPLIPLEELEKHIPEVDWRNGHSGEMLSDNAADILDMLLRETFEY